MHRLLRLLGAGPSPIAELSDRLHISADQVRTLIAELAGYGARIRRSGAGVHLDADLIDLKQIRDLLPEVRVDYRPVIDSTNTRLQNLAWALPSGTVCVSEYQTAGRGRLGRRWQAPFAGGLCFSVLWHFDQGCDLSGLSLAVGVAVAETLDHCGCQVGLKWPNDIVVKGSKLGGVLVQLKRKSAGLAAIIGVGINVDLAEAAPIDQPWIDLIRLCPSGLPNRTDLLASLTHRIHRALQTFDAHGFGPFLDAWGTMDTLANRAIRVANVDGSTEGVARGISAVGALRVELPDGRTTEFAGGEVSVRVA